MTFFCFKQPHSGGNNSLWPVPHHVLVRYRAQVASADALQVPTSLVGVQAGSPCLQGGGSAVV